MAFVITNAGKIKFLELALKDTSPSTVTIRLFNNSVTPSITDDIDNYIELTDTTDHNYSAQTVTKGNWSISYDTGASKVKATALGKSFVLNSSGSPMSVYGYFLTVTDGSTVKLIGAEKFNVAVNINSGGTITINSQIIY